MQRDGDSSQACSAHFGVYTHYRSHGTGFPPAPTPQVLGGEAMSSPSQIGHSLDEGHKV